MGAFFTATGRKKPGYPLQSSGFCCAKSARISASIQAAWTSSNPNGIATSPLRRQETPPMLGLRQKPAEGEVRLRHTSPCFNKQEAP
jgi:hypothetical protein